MKFTLKVFGQSIIFVRKQATQFFRASGFIRFLCAVCLLLFSFQFLQAATLPAGFTETLVANGFGGATAMAFAPDGRLFVCEQGGQVRVIKNGSLLPTPFLTVSTDTGGERGLLGIAFDPNFTTNRFVYIYYTVTSNPRHNRVSRFTANGDVAVANSETVILELENLSATNHNGGAIHFGADSKLYVAVGENAVPSNSQTLNNRLGKILRINADGTIPSDNPFFNTATGVNRSIWALGLRNPYTFAFQPGTGRMFINDVGQSLSEEINDGIAGANYGWPTYEGSCPNPNFRNPIFEYGHGSGATLGCAITGGTFYNPPVNQFPLEYVGKYFFADLCSGWICLLNPANNSVTPFASGISFPVDLKVGPDGNLYYLARGNGTIFKISFTANQAPTIGAHPSSQTVTEGASVTFSVAATGAAPLSYQWQRNGVNISGATNSSYTISPALLADNGAKFRCVVSNSFGSAQSNEATLTVNASNPPTPILLTEENTGLLIALDSVTMMREPFPLITNHNFSSDRRTRVMLFALNVELMPGENSSVVTAQAEDAQHILYPLTVEYVGKVSGFSWLTQIVVRFPDQLANKNEVLVNISLRGIASNKAIVKLKP